MPTKRKQSIPSIDDLLAELASTHRQQMESPTMNDVWRRRNELVDQVCDALGYRRSCRTDGSWNDRIDFLDQHVPNWRGFSLRGSGR